MIKYKTQITKFDTNTLMYESYLPIPEDIYQKALKNSPDKRIKCIIDGKVEHYCAMFSKGETFRYILLNKSILKTLGKQPNDNVDVEIHKQKLKYGIPISKEMEEVLNADTEGSEIFHNLTVGMQRTLIHMISKYKNPQLRIDRSIILLRHLILRNGNLDYKILIQNFKDGI